MFEEVSYDDLSAEVQESVRLELGAKPGPRVRVARVNAPGGTVSLALRRAAQLGLSPDPHILRKSFDDVVNVQMRLYRGRSGNEWRVGSFTDREGHTVVLLGK